MFECLFECLKDLPAITAFITARKKKCNQKLNNEQLSWSFERKQKTHSYCYFSLCPFASYSFG